MRRIYLGFFLAASLTGCTASGSDTPLSTKASPSSGTSANAVQPTPPLLPANAEIPNSNVSFADRAANRTHGKANVVIKGTPAPLEFKPGPENSELATTMNAEGQPVEVRVFKSDPRIRRVEATWLDEKKKLLRITLKDGRMVEVRTETVSSLRSVSASELAALASAQK